MFFILLKFFLTLIPIASITFVIFLIISKLYIKIRSQFNITVNCWFCNENGRVPYLEANSWTCLHCEQYNGFTKDGDYNKDIHHPDTFKSHSFTRRSINGCFSHKNYVLFPRPTMKNGFCNECNENQSLKIKKLSQFEPKYESRYDAELKVFKENLEEQYRLCSTCDHHLNKILREKKKIVLGAKFLDFIIKGAQKVKHTHFKKIKDIQKLKCKRLLCLIIATISLLNILCLLNTLPSLKRENFVNILGETIAKYTFFVWFHALAFLRVFFGYISLIFTHPFIEKFVLFLRTIFMMILYSMKIKTANISMQKIYINSCPFIILGLSLIYNIIDGLKLSRFSFILTLWSFFAAGIDPQVVFGEEVLKILACVMTITLAITNSNDGRNSFFETTSDNILHKIYCDDNDTEEETRETISMLSHNLNCSTFSSSSSLNSTKNRSLTKNCHNEISKINQKSPSISSVNSRDLNQRLRLPKNFQINKPTFASNSEINYSNQLQSAFGNVKSFNSPQNVQQHNYDFNTFTQNPDVDYNIMPLVSPFNISSNSVYHQRNDVLSPARFRSNNLTMTTPIGTYFSGDNLNNKTFVFRQTQSHQRNYWQNVNVEEISRTSSRSSGFESQLIGGDRSTRENSVDLNTMNETLNNTAATCSSCDSFSDPLCAQNIFTPMQPHAINFNQERWLNHTSRNQSNNHDSFNLQKINDYLPSTQNKFICN